LVRKYSVQDLYYHHGEQLQLELIAGKAGLQRLIRVPEAHRPGLALSGYLKGYAPFRILVLGKVEIEYLRDLPSEMRILRLEALFSEKTPAVILSRGYKPLKELRHLCERLSIPLFRAQSSTMSLLAKLSLLLFEEFSMSTVYHGTLVEVYGVGVFIQGDSSVGKSEAALGLIERGHRLISDDTVRIKKREGSYLEGFGIELTRHLIEIRGIGIINVAHLYGAVCVRDSKSIDIIVKLEAWDEQRFYDRLGLEEAFCDILGVKVPYHTLPVKPGRDVVLLLETIALEHRLKTMGYNSTKELTQKLTEEMAIKAKKRQGNFHAPHQKSDH
jgi:HPr kinase/phosphorylase